MKGVDWVGLTPPEYRPGDDDLIREAIASGAGGWRAKEFVKPDGTRVAVEVLVVALERDPFRWMSLLRRKPERRPGTDVATPVAGALLRLARRLAGTGSVEDLLQVVDRLLAPAMGASYANVALLDEDGASLRIHHDPGTDADVKDRWITVPVTRRHAVGRRGDVRPDAALRQPR